MSSPRIAFGLSLALSFACSQALAAPQKDDPEGRLVKDMVRDAATAQKAGKCKEANSILRQAAAIRETGEVLLYVGECQAQAGGLLEALKTWENAEDVARNEKDRATQQLIAQRIEQLRARVPTILLRLPKDVGRVAVKIDDTPQPPERVSTPILVNPGEHTLSVTADQRQPFTKKLSLVEKDGAVINVALPLIGAPAGPAPEEPAPAAKPQPLVPLGTWIAGGATVVLAAGGVISFVAAGSTAADGKTQCSTMVTCDPSKKSQVHELDGLALGLWIGAGASAAFAVTWFFVNKPKAAPTEPAPTGRERGPGAPSLTAAVTVTPTGAWLRGTF